MAKKNISIIYYDSLLNLRSVLNKIYHLSKTENPLIAYIDKYGKEGKFYFEFDLSGIKIEKFNTKLHLFDDEWLVIPHSIDIPVQVIANMVSAAKQKKPDWAADIECSGKADKLLLFLYFLGSYGNPGHSFGFYIGDTEKEFCFDGDGSDRVIKILDGETVMYGGSLKNSKELEKMLEESGYLKNNSPEK